MTPPVFAHGHLRLYLLGLLAAQPMHGYDLMQALSDRFGGTYTPSAGTIYPRLSKLEEDGLVTKETDGRRTVYVITDAGRTELAARQGELDGIETELSDSVRRLADEVRASVDGAMKSLRADLAAAARDSREAPRAPSTPLAGTDETRIRLRDADLALSDFRAELRIELRKAAARGELGEDAVRALRDGLAAIRTEVAALLTRP